MVKKILLEQSARAGMISFPTKEEEANYQKTKTKFFEL
jgi:hypothetical protein